MENQTGRKIKVLRYDHVEEYKDFFLAIWAEQWYCYPLYK